jgi:hypothetical protein
MTAMVKKLITRPRECSRTVYSPCLTFLLQLLIEPLRHAPAGAASISNPPLLFAEKSR